MASFNRFNVLSDTDAEDSKPVIKITDNSADNIKNDDFSELKKVANSIVSQNKPSLPVLISDKNQEVIPDNNDTKEEIDSNVDELLGVMLNLPVKIRSSFWNDNLNFDEPFKSLSEFSKKFTTFLINHGDYQLDDLFAAMEANNTLIPTRSTILEFCLYSLAKSNTFFKKQDYDILDKICKTRKNKLRFSAIIGGRDVGMCQMNNFGDSGLELTFETVKTLKLFIPVLNYLQRNNKIIFDYPQFHGDISRGIKGIDAHTLNYFTHVKNWSDRYGVCYYNVYRKDMKTENRNFTKYLAVLSYIKGLMYPKSIRE